MFEATLCFSMSQHYAENFQINNHSHDCYEIVYYVDGTGISKIQDVEYNYSNNTFCVIPPDMAHSEQTKSKVDLLYIGFNYDRTLGNLPIGVLEDDEERTIYHIICKMQREFHNQGLHYDNMLSCLQKELILHLLRRTDTSTITVKRTRDCMEYAMNYINSNFGTPIDLENLADNVGYSYHHFRHIFKDTYGISPKQYILNARMNQAKLLLQKGDLSVKEVSQMCGFKSSSQFITMFKKHTGLSPLVYKQVSDKFEERARYE